MQFLQQARNRMLFIVVSFIATVGLLIAINPDASVLSVLSFASLINALIYAALPEWYESK